MKFLSGCLGIRNSDSTTIFLGVPKYWKPSCIVFLFRGLEILYLSFVVWGIRNSESFPVLFGGSEILNLLCCLGIRNSESSPVLFGGSEILNLLCCFGGQKFVSFPQLICHIINTYFFHGNIWTHNWPAPNVSGFIAQLVEHRTGIARSRVQTPLKSWIFSGFFTQFHKLRSLRRSFLHFYFISAVHIWFISYIIITVILAIFSSLHVLIHIPVFWFGVVCCHLNIWDTYWRYVFYPV